MERVRSRVLESPVLLGAVVAANLAGAAFGIYYYWSQLLSTEWFLLPLVPDSATAVLIFALALGLQARGRSGPLLNYLAGCLVVTYGAWTVSVLLLDPGHYFRPVGSDWFLFNVFLIAVPHIGMVLEVSLLDLGEVNGAVRVSVLSLLLLNWAVDYGLGTYTAIPGDIVTEAAAVSLLLVLVTGLRLEGVRALVLRL